MPEAISCQLCRSCSKGLSQLVPESNDMSFFQLFQYCQGSGLGTTGDFSSEQLLHDFHVVETYQNSYRTTPNPGPSHF